MDELYTDLQRIDRQIENVIQSIPLNEMTYDRTNKVKVNFIRSEYYRLKKIRRLLTEIMKEIIDHANSNLKF